MCQAVVLAAGYSSRAQLNKLALKIDGVPILRRIVMTLLQLCEEVVVVSGHYHDAVLELVGELEGVRVVYNEAYDLGMFSSVLKGIGQINSDCFLIPGDYPLIQASTCQAMLLAKGPVVVPVFKGRRGHPILLKGASVNQLKLEALTSNLRTFRDRYDVTYIDVEDEGILLDVDTIEDYEAIGRVWSK